MYEIFAESRQNSSPFCLSIFWLKKIPRSATVPYVEGGSPLPLTGGWGWWKRSAPLHCIFKNGKKMYTPGKIPGNCKQPKKKVASRLALHIDAIIILLCFFSRRRRPRSITTKKHMFVAPCGKFSATQTTNCGFRLAVKSVAAWKMGSHWSSKWCGREKCLF